MAPRPAGVHAKLIVCDTEWAVVSSCNVLNSSENRREFELGVKIRPLQDAAACSPVDENSAATWSAADHRSLAAAAVCECLRFARSILPDYILRALISDDPTLDGRRLLAPPVEIGGEIESPDYPAIWLATLRRRAEAVKERIERLSSLAQPVIDGQHREFFVSALQTACRRIVVSSKDLGIGLLGGTVADLVLEARGRGVEVKVVHAGHADWSDELQRRKDELEQAGVTFLVRDVHAKVLVCDDWVIVSSFNFLSFAGYYDMHRRPATSSVYVSSAAISRTISWVTSTPRGHADFGWSSAGCPMAAQPPPRRLSSYEDMTPTEEGELRPSVLSGGRPVTLSSHKKPSSTSLVLPVDDSCTDCGLLSKASLGRPQFLNKEDSRLYSRWPPALEVQQIHNLLRQRIEQQNSGCLVRFEARLGLADDEMVVFNTIEELLAYDAPRRITSSFLDIAWDYLVKFSDKKTPERQRIQIKIRSESDLSNNADEEEDTLYLGPGRIHMLIAARLLSFQLNTQPNLG